VSGLKLNVESIQLREGGDNNAIQIVPGATQYVPITLERGLTHDTSFEAWANKITSIEGDGAVSLKDYRKDIAIDILNLQGSTVLSYFVFGCWVTEYEAIANLDAHDTQIAIERLVLNHRGWARDTDVSEPSES